MISEVVIVKLVCPHIVAGSLALMIALVAAAAHAPVGMTYAAGRDSLIPPSEHLQLAHDEGMGNEPLSKPRFPFIPIADVIASAARIISPGDTGTLVIPGAEIAVPPGAVSKPTQFHVRQVMLEEQEMTDSRSVFVLTGFDPDDSLQRPVTEFETPLAVRLLPETDNCHAHDLLIHRYSPGLKAWVPMPSIANISDSFLCTEVHRPEVLAILSTDRPKDVQQHWAESDILHLMAAGAVEGYPDGTFQPEKGISREEFARMLVKTAGLDVRYQPHGSPMVDMRGELSERTDPYMITGHGPPGLSGRLAYLIRDAPHVSEWAAPYVEAAIMSGLMAGFADGTFRPQEPLTRVQLAILLAQAMKLDPAPDHLPFPDAEKIPAWGRGAVGALAALDVVSGYPEAKGAFRPWARATRAESARALSRALALSLPY